MITFNKIRWKNFLSTGNVFTEIDLTKNKIGSWGEVEKYCSIFQLLNRDGSITGVSLEVRASSTQ